jgi:5-(aminomethyl)-3-furanmethanol phosphate kinase
MWVLHLSSSLIGQTSLLAWLDLVERLGDGKVVIVPDAGDMLLSTQWALSKYEVSLIPEAYAQRMSLRAMEQYGLLMRGLNPKLVEGHTELELAERGWQHRGIVWMPSHMVQREKELINQANVGASSLSAWLAHRLGASHLVMVGDYDKSLQDKPFAIQDDTVLETLFDANFKRLIQAQPRTSYSTWVLNAKHHPLFATGFDTGILESVGQNIQV